MPFKRAGGTRCKQKDTSRGEDTPTVISYNTPFCKTFSQLCLHHLQQQRLLQPAAKDVAVELRCDSLGSVLGIRVRSLAKTQGLKSTTSRRNSGAASTTPEGMGNGRVWSFNVVNLAP